jgi:hypothetical protein
VLNRLIWFRVNAGNWNNNVANNPVTGWAASTSRRSLPGTLTAAISASITGNVWTMKFSTPFTEHPADRLRVDRHDRLFTLASTAPTGRPLPIVTSLPASYDLTSRASRRPRASTSALQGPSPSSAARPRKWGWPVASKKVEVYDRNTGELLGTTLSDGSGNWSIPCLGRPAVRVVGSDPTTYNSVVYDNVVPV